MGKLTEIRCRTAKCEGQKILKLGDGEGLYLWVFAHGGKSFYFRYKWDGKERGLSLGTYPRVSLADARIEARRMADLLRRGVDPSSERKRVAEVQAASVANTFEAVAREWYKKQKNAWVESHARDVLRRMEVNLFPYIGSRPISEIDSAELLDVLGKIEGRGAFDLAHRVNGVASQIFRYAIIKGLCKYDVAAGLRGALTVHVPKNQPAVSQKHLPALMLAISEYHGDEQTQLGLMLLAHTFVRTKELIMAKWTEFDFKERLWEVPAERMKKRNDHLVPLTDASITILQRLKVLAGDSEYILPGRNALTHISNNTLLYALYRMGYKSRMTGHGFRAVASTILNEEGFNPDWIERQLAHVEENKVRGAYNRALYLKDRRGMMEWWSGYLLQISHVS